MGIFSDFLLTADLDRTLTAPDGSIPERNLDAIRYFMANGGVFTVNTGRSVPMYHRYLDRVPVNAPLLLYNGSAAYDRGELAMCRYIDLDMWQTVEELQDRFPELNLELQGVRAHYRFRENPAWDRLCASQGCAYALARPGFQEPFLKFALLGRIRESTVAEMFQATPEELARMDEAEAWLTRRWGEKLTVFRSAPRLIDVQAKGVSKLRTARELQTALGRKYLVCVGDAENDVPMLEGADYAFCPADGIVADRFSNVCPCGEGALADVILEKIPEILGERLTTEGKYAKID